MTEAQEGLEQFLTAQAGVFDQALAELRRGRKESHWMWFVFPQIAGLGFSPMAQRYAIESLDEARRYLAHPVLGGRLLLATDAVLGHADRSPEQIFGDIDAMKFRSSLTLFDAADDNPNSIYNYALEIFFNREPDPKTLALLG